MLDEEFPDVPFDPDFADAQSGFPGLYDRQDRIEGLDVPKKVSVFFLVPRQTSEEYRRTCGTLVWTTLLALAMVGVRRMRVSRNLPNQVIDSIQKLVQMRANLRIEVMSEKRMIQTLRKEKGDEEELLLLDYHGMSFRPGGRASMLGAEGTLGSAMGELKHTRGLDFVRDQAAWPVWKASYLASLEESELLRSSFAGKVLIASPVVGGLLRSRNPKDALRVRVEFPEHLRRCSTWFVPAYDGGMQNRVPHSPWDWETVDALTGLYAVHALCHRPDFALPAKGGAFWHVAAVPARLALGLVETLGVAFRKTRRTAESKKDFRLFPDVDRMHSVPVSTNKTLKLAVYGMGGIGWNFSLAAAMRRGPHDLVNDNHDPNCVGMFNGDFMALFDVNNLVVAFDDDRLELHNLARLPCLLRWGLTLKPQVYSLGFEGYANVRTARVTNASFVPPLREEIRYAVDCRDDLRPEDINRDRPTIFKLSYDGGDGVNFYFRPELTADRLLAVERPAYAVDPSYYVAPAILSELALYLMRIAPIEKTTQMEDERVSKSFDFSLTELLRAEREASP